MVKLVVTQATWLWTLNLYTLLFVMLHEHITRGPDLVIGSEEISMKKEIWADIWRLSMS